MPTAELVTMTKIWKQPKCSSTEEWIKKMWGTYTNTHIMEHQFSSVAQLCLTLCNPMDHSTPGLPVHHQLPEFTKLMSIESVMPSSHLILCHPLLLLPSIFPSSRVFSNESLSHNKRMKFHHLQQQRWT